MSNSELCIEEKCMVYLVGLGCFGWAGLVMYLIPTMAESMGSVWAAILAMILAGGPIIILLVWVLAKHKKCPCCKGHAKNTDGIDNVDNVVNTTEEVGQFIDGPSAPQNSATNMDNGIKVVAVSSVATQPDEVKSVDENKTSIVDPYDSKISYQTFERREMNVPIIVPRRPAYSINLRVIVDGD